MRNRRTDLALEARELWQESAEERTQLEGVEAREEMREGIPVTRVSILDRRGEEALGKPVGTYVTLTLDGLARREEDAFGRAARAVAAELGELLGFLHPEAPVLVVGLGNRAITPDAVGPKVHEYTLVTRHLVRQVPEHFGDLRPVASLSAGVLGTTGMESGELVRAVSERLRPACVIAVDALASRSLKRGGECHGEVVLLLKIPVIGAVVHMGVGAQDACRLQPRLQQGLLDLLPLLGQPAVQENTPPVVQQVQGDQLVGLQHPGAALHLCQLHLLLLCPHLPR